MSATRERPSSFGPEEAAEIFREAAGEGVARVGTSPERLDLEELKRIGAEAGIDPAAIERAANAVGARSPRYVPRSATKDALRVERTEALSLTADRFDVAADVLRDVLGEGEVRMLGTSLVWTSRADPRKDTLEVRLKPLDGRLLLQAELRRAPGDLKPPVAGALVGALVALFGTLVTIPSAGEPLGLAYAGLAGVALGAAFWKGGAVLWSSRSRRLQRDLARIVRSLRGVLA